VISDLRCQGSAILPVITDELAFPDLALSPSFREQVLEHLREQIIAGELAPGALLTPATLASQLRTSTMPIRDALRVLEREGLVEVSARRFTRVASPRREIADEAYPVLGLLEGFCLRRGIALSAEAIVQAEKANEALAKAADTSERLRADVLFHRAITSVAGPTTRAILSTLYGQIALLEVGYHRTYRPKKSTTEHARIISALRDGNQNAAANLVEKHWRRGHAAILPLLDSSAGELDASEQA
jgi:DNA-binding GntR family transcriptional regulator